MSWEEYKKKREETSSWEQYKQKRQANVSKNTVTTKSSTNNKTSLWDNIQNLASETGKVADNLWQSFKNGVMSYQQTVGRAANNTQAQHADLINRMHQKALEGRLKDNPEETEQINKIINNPLISGDKIRQESKEYYNKIQEKKKENTLKIQQNAESMNTEVGKYIAGEIAPGIGQMLPGMIGGPIGTTYFIGSATGNYYDDAKQRGMTEDQATIYSGVMGIIEGSLEAVGAKLTTNVGKQLLRKNIKGALVNYGLDIGENFLEESIVEPLSEIVATTAAGKDKADWSNIGQRMWQSGVAGAITSAIMGGASGAIGSVGSKVTQQNKYVDYNTNKKLDQNSQDILKQAENIIQKNNATNLQPQTMQNTQNMPSQQLMPSQQENAHNTNMKINKTLPMQNYIYEKSDNVKIDKFRQSASQNFDNSVESRNYLNMLERIITDKDVDIIFDANLKDSQGRIANGSYSNGVITINPNSNRTGEFIAIHELTHAIGTNQMRNIVEQYRKSNKAFDSAVQQLLKNYNTTELTEEAMADVSAQLFGNQEFINNLAEREPSLFRKIYNEIKYLWHQFTGYKNQNQFIEDLQYKWEQAYRNNNKLNETTNYYIEPVAKFDEIEYNNVIEEKLNKREYAILRSIINSDSNIKPGINYVEVTNGRYTVYYKGFDDFKVMSRKVDADAGRINKRNDTTGGKTRYSKTFEQSIRDQGTTTSNDEVSNFNTSGTRERSGSNTSSSTNIENGINLSTKESENNSGSFNLQDNQGRTLTKEQQEYFKDSKVRDENGNLLTMYHGTPNGYYTIFKDGTYFSPRKEYADGYQNTWASAISTKQNANNPKTYEVYLNITNPFTLQNPEAKSIYLNEFIKGGNSLSYDPYTDWTKDINNLDEIDWTEAEDLREWLVENHPEYDGLILDEGGDGGYGEAEYRWRGKSFVPFNANQIKNVDNTNPTDNPDIRYSLPTKEWQQYLDENYKPTGTKTNLADIRLPINENSEKSSFNMPTKQNTTKIPQKETNVDKYNRYKQNILKGRAEEVNNLISYKNETINEIEQQIKKKTQELNSKADKTTKVANNLKMQIENLKQRKTKIENEYNSKIDRKFDKVSKDKINLETKKELGITRKEIQQNLLEDTGILNESLDNAQNISMANMNRTDPIRLQEKVFGRELGTKINDMFFNKIKHNTAEKTRFLNSERNDIKNWGIKARSFESEVLQKYTEKTYVTEEGKEISYTEADLIKDIPNQEIRNKIKKASEELRKKYDNYIETANEVLVGLGYDAIPKRKDYVRHFTELNDIFTKFGIPGKLDNALPTDINGITDTFRPGKNFFANAQKRHGNKTTYDAITGIDGYIEGISNLIYHTEDIQRLRTLDKYIRESYGEKGFENLESLSEEERNTRIQKISENHLSNYVSWLTEYTNNLAGKKSGIDRSVEKLLGRNVYSALDTIKKQTGSNMTGFNIGSALTNFISVTQGASKTKKLALLKGTASTIQNMFNNDGFVDKSDFLTNRFGSDRISNTLWQKVSNVGQVFMSATDYFSSNLIVRSKYYENLAKGMSEVEALKNADDFGARILGDRSQGSTANVFNSKMLGILTQFQLEVNNQMDTMIHDTVQDFKTIEGERGALKASMGAVWTLGQMAAYQYIFNNIFQAIAGRRPAFDVIDILKTALGIDDEDEEDSVKDNLQEAAIKLIEGLPFLNLLSEDARVPIASAIPNPISVATGDSTLKDEVSKLVYLLPPTGGSQAKKTIDGVKTVMDGGSYVINSKGEKELRFPVEDKNALSYIKAGTLGKYSLPLAQEYVDRDYKRLSAKQTKTYEESKVPFKEYLEYIEAGLKTNEDKINYLESKEMNTEQKWGIYTNDLFSSTERKEDGGSQLSDAKYITSNGVSKSEYIKIYNKAQKNNIDMPTAKEYKEMKANNVTLKNYIEYKVKVKEVTESKRKIKELSSTENLKNADKIQILLDSNYSNKEISAIYANYIKSEKDTEYDIMKATEIDIKEYLKYKQQEFKSDKDDDGTLAGKTVSKSKQKKVVEYLNSNIKNGNQRLLLYAMRGYSMTSSQKSQVANYVKGLKIDNNTKLKLYDKFSGFTVYKDGTIKY